MEVIIIILLDILLFIAGIQDIKIKKIGRKLIMWIFGMAISAVVVRFIAGGGMSLFNILGGASVGGFMFGISILTKEQIGRGDCYIMTALGILMGFRNSISVLCIASCIMAFISIILICAKKGNKNTRIPFVPSVFTAFTVYLILNYVSGMELI